MRKWITATAFVLLLGACAPGYEGMPGATTTDPPSGVEAATAALAAARARWAASGATDYTYQFTDDCGECGPQARTPRTVAVLAGRVLAVEHSNLPTVEEIFVRIEQALQAGRRVEVSYDLVTGLPVDVQIDMDMRPVDGGTHWIVEDLTHLAPVESVEQLRAARRLWDSQGLNDYRFLLEVVCECPEQGTFDVKVVGDQVVDVTRLDSGSEADTVNPVTINRTFDDFEEWFTDTETLIDEGILDVDVRVDPVIGYPRWVKLEAAYLDTRPPFTIVVTMELVGPIDPGEFSPQPDQDDLAALEQARGLWEATGLSDYRYTLTVHCNCPEQYVGPFEVIVRDTSIVSATWKNEPLEPGGAAIYTVDAMFTMIEQAIQDGTDVDVTYDQARGHPLTVVINPEAVAVDGGLAFTIDNLTPFGKPGGLAGQVLAGPTCPVQQSPPDPACADRPVQGAVLVVFDGKQREVTRITTNPNGYFQASLDPGSYHIEPQPAEGLLGTAAPFEVEIRPGATNEVTVTYDTGIR
jgi:hypothetical protein